MARAASPRQPFCFEELLWHVPVSSVLSDFASPEYRQCVRVLSNRAARPVAALLIRPSESRTVQTE
jgi:hypothetical protein